MDVIQHTSYIGNMRFSPDGRLLAAVSTVSVELWDIQTRERILSQSLSNQYVSAIAFSPNGQILVYQNADHTVLWDVAKNIQISLQEGLERGAAAIEFSPDGRVLAVSGERRIELWDLDRSIVFAQYDNVGGVDDPECMYGCVPTDGLTDTTDLEFSPDGSLLVSANAVGTLTVWTVRGNGAEMRLEESRVVGGFDYHYPTSMAFSPDGTRVVTISLTWDGPSDNRLKLWDVSQGVLLETFQEGHTQAATSLAFSPDGSTLASGGGMWDGTVRVWDVASGRQQSVMNLWSNEVRLVQFSSDGSLVASLSEGGAGEGSRYMVHLWDAETGSARAMIPGAWFDSAFSLAFSLDGTLLVSDVVLSDANLPVSIWRLDELLQGDGVIEDPGFVEEQTGGSRAMAAAFSPDGAMLATVTYDGTIQLWDTATYTEIASFGGGIALAQFLAYSPHGSLIASGGYEMRNEDNRIYEQPGVWLWDARTGTQRAFIERSTRVTGLAFSPDNSMLATIGWDGLELWDTANVTLLATFADARGPVAFSPDGALLATAGEGNTVVLWHIPSS